MSDIPHAFLRHIIVRLSSSSKTRKTGSLHSLLLMDESEHFRAKLKLDRSYKLRDVRPRELLYLETFLKQSEISQKFAFK